jgi:tetratricopeptide (TPR) repeat protein
MKPVYLCALLLPFALGSIVTSAEKAPATTPAAPAAHDHDEPGHSHRHDDNKTVDPTKESNTDYFWRKSDEAFHAGDYPRAIALHRAIVALDPTDTQSFGTAAWLMWSLGNADEANAHLQRGLKLNPENADMWNEAAQQYDLQKKFTQARDAYVNALKFTPTGEDTNMLRRRFAHTAEKAGDLKLSLETWQGLAKDYPDDAVIKNNLARVEKLTYER